MSEARWEAPSHDGIRERLSNSANARIDRETQVAIDEASRSPEQIQARIADLDREWNIDRALMLNFAIVGGLASSLAMRSLARRDKLGGWGALFFTQLVFLANHAVRRWCPPMPVFRRLGFRSQQEIEAERCVLQQELQRYLDRLH